MSAKKVKTTPEKAPKSALKKSAPAAENTSKVAPVAAAPVRNNPRPARKRAEDFLEKAEVKTAPRKAAPKAKQIVEKQAEEPVEEKSAAAKVTKSKGKKATAKPSEKQKEEDVVPVEDDNDAEEDEDDVDDQTAALLAGFDSSEDEQDPEADEEGVSMDKVPALPDEKNVRKQLNSAEKAGEENKPGVLYVG